MRTPQSPHGTTARTRPERAWLDLVADLEWWEEPRSASVARCSAGRPQHGQSYVGEREFELFAELDAGCTQLVADLVLVRRHVLVGEDQGFESCCVAVRELVDERGIFAIVSIHGGISAGQKNMVTPVALPPG